ncbi:uncharacterized protein LOC143548335 [Bidens hawaiensis]|uniref:uncharacterized protein LOC143548335 n=1 Tax=Bidens hawaiensis TaxID=980011 RepID=UPI004049ED16
MLSDSKLPVNFWLEAVVAACYTLNRVLTVKKYGKTCFELLNHQIPNLKWLQPFGSTCKVLEPSGKFGPKSIEGFFVGYASPLRRVYIPSLHKIIQIQNFDCQRYTPTIQRPGDSRLFDYESLWESFQLPEEDLSEETLTMIYNQHLSKNQVTMPEEHVSVSQYVPDIDQSDGVPETVLVFYDDGDTDEEIIEAISPSTVVPEMCESNLQTEVLVPLEVVPRTLSYHPKEICTLGCRREVKLNRIYNVEPKTYKEALIEEGLVNAMQEELMQFEKLGARLVVLGFNQREGIDYNEVYAPVATLEPIRIFLVFASWKGFKVYQLDVKSAFLNDKISEEVYVGQPLGFVYPIHKDKAYLLDKALYGLHQAPRAWYETLSQHLLENDFIRGTVDCTLFTKFVDGHLLIVHIYFEEVMKKKFEMSAMGEMKFFLRLQVEQLSDGIFIHQTKYVNDILTKFNMSDASAISTPLPLDHCIGPDPNG